MSINLEYENGIKYDDGKNRLDLFDSDFIEDVSKVLTFGAKKYSDNNWRKGLAFSRLFGAAMRHLWAYWRGEDSDPETGLSHLAHAGCCIMFLLWHDKHRKDLDDRWKSKELRDMSQLVNGSQSISTEH